MKAHALAKALLEGPDLPVVFAWGEHGDLVHVQRVAEVPEPRSLEVHGVWGGSVLELED